MLIVPSAYALQKTAQYSSVNEEETRCFVDIGERFTELVIFKGKHLTFARKIPVCGIDFTKVMTGTLVSDRGQTQLPISEAERIKKDVGIPAEGDVKIIDGKISTVQILSMLRTPLEQLTSEIDRCFDYYREETDGGKIDMLILFGGGAALGGLAKAVSEALGVETKLGDSLEGLKIEKGAIAGNGKASLEMDIAVGAALSVAKGINLLPRAAKEKIRIVFAVGTMKIAAASILLVLAIIYIGMQVQLVDFRKRIVKAKSELSLIEPQFRKAEAQIAANKVLVNEPQWEDILTELSNIIPDTIYITSFSMRNSIITINGIVSVEDGEQVLSDFILTSEKGLFNNVKLVSSRKLGEKGGTEFELRCWVDYEDKNR